MCLGLDRTELDSSAKHLRRGKSKSCPLGTPTVKCSLEGNNLYNNAWTQTERSKVIPHLIMSEFLWAKVPPYTTFLGLVVW